MTTKINKRDLIALGLAGAAAARGRRSRDRATRSDSSRRGA